MDLWFGFRHLNYSGFTASAAELTLSDTMATYWTRFAATVNPNDPSVPAWPKYDAALDSYLSLAPPRGRHGNPHRAVRLLGSVKGISAHRGVSASPLLRSSFN